LGEAHAHDRGGDAVGGRHRHAEMRCQREDGGRAGFRGETVDRMQLDHLVAHRLDYLPAARGRAQRHHHRAGHHDPDRDFLLAAAARMQEGGPARQVVQRGRASRCSTPSERAIAAMIAHSSSITTTPSAKPAAGEVIIGSTTFHSRPPFSFQLPTGSDQISAVQSLCAAETAAPHRPPISACDDDDGSPFHQVIRFQMMPPPSAHRITCEVTATTSVSTRPDAIVIATAVPVSAPTRFITAAMITACPGVSTLVATTVAMELAVSWKPLMNSNTSAAKITTSTRVSMRQPPRQLFLSTIW